jgi:hypothetical protein
MNIPSSVPKLIVAHPLFRYEDPNQAGWKAGSNGIVGLHKKWWCVKTKKKALSEETKRGLLVPGAKKNLIKRVFNILMRIISPYPSLYLLFKYRARFFFNF